MAAGWYCKIADRQIGPLSAQQLKAMAQNGDLRPDDPVRQGNEGPWVAAQRVKGLFAESTSSQARRPAQPPPVTHPYAEPPVAPPPPSAAPPVAEPGNVFDMLANAAYEHPSSARAPRRADPHPAKGGGRGAHHGDDSHGGRNKDQQKKKQLVMWLAIGCVVLIGAFVGIVVYQQFKSADPAPTADAQKPKPEAKKDTPADDKTVAKPEAKPDTAAAKPEPAKPDVPKPGTSKLDDQAGNVKVMLQGAAEGKAPFLRSPGKSAADSKYLIVHVVMLNSSPTKKLSYAGWNFSRGAMPRAIDEHGSEYKLLTFAPGQVAGQQIPASFYPQKKLEDVLIFEAPTDAATQFRVELPGAVFNEKGTLTLEFPRKSVKPVDASALPTPPEEPATPAVPKAPAMDEDEPPRKRTSRPISEDPDKPPPLDIGKGDFDRDKPVKP